uniref:ATP synthase F0 subunit 8 n=1 Tax=Cucujoidea sp. 1 KM-2017 TaxID=2219345 RepID=A0A346RJE6_9CUCU|nr:ATP synthase F0 subunit 8 [Cucujoidea sp. 1 KM-2017]
MPQMMPLNWMMEFMFFIFIFLIINTFIYFNFTKKFYSLKNKYYFSVNWKW